MKTTKLIARIVLSPLMFVIVFVFTFIVAVNNLILFARYGGEFINYDKDDSKHIYDIYELLKKQNKGSKDSKDSNNKWSDIIKDPDNKGQTITEKEYLLRRGVDVDKLIRK